MRLRNPAKTKVASAAQTPNLSLEINGAPDKKFIRAPNNNRFNEAHERCRVATTLSIGRLRVPCVQLGGGACKSVQTIQQFRVGPSFAGTSVSRRSAAMVRRAAQGAR